MQSEPDIRGGILVIVIMTYSNSAAKNLVIIPECQVLVLLGRYRCQPAFPTHPKREIRLEMRNCEG